MAEIKVTGVARTSERLGHLVDIFRYYSTHNGRLIIFPEFKNRHWVDSVQIYNLAPAIFKVLLTVASSISREHWIFTCITFMEHLDALCIPVFYKSMMTIELHLVCFAVVVTLIQNSGMINIFSVSNPDIFNEKRGWVRSSFYFFNIIIELSI